MMTTTLPTRHTHMGSGSAGTPYGHVPGHTYRDVDVLISHRADSYRCEIVYSWGSCQGDDEEHGRRSAIGRGASIDQACEDGERRAIKAEIQERYMASALAEARDQAYDHEVQ